jgi:hypothetical protein
MRALIGYGLLMAATATGAWAGLTQEHVGSWVISCPGEAPCTMRFNKRFLDKSGITGNLEVQAQGRTLVPVLTLRGLSSELLMAAAMVGKTEASLQFAGGTRQELDCAVNESSYICTPNEATTPKLAAGLAAAPRVTVRVAVSVTGMNPLPSQERSLDLAGTADALARLRAVGPTPVPTMKTALAAQSPAGLMGAADRALKAAGYADGLAGLQARLAQYLRK